MSSPASRPPVQPHPEEDEEAGASRRGRLATRIGRGRRARRLQPLPRRLDAADRPNTGESPARARSRRPNPAWGRAAVLPSPRARDHAVRPTFSALVVPEGLWGPRSLVANPCSPVPCPGSDQTALAAPASPTKAEGARSRGRRDGVWMARRITIRAVRSLGGRPDLQHPAPKGRRLPIELPPRLSSLRRCARRRRPCVGCITLCGCAGNAGPTPAGAPGMLETGWLRRCAGENARCPARKELPRVRILVVDDDPAVSGSLDGTAPRGLRSRDREPTAPRRCAPWASLTRRGRLDLQLPMSTASRCAAVAGGRRRHPGP